MGEKGRRTRVEEWERCERGFREKNGNKSHARRVSGLSMPTVTKIWEEGIEVEVEGGGLEHKRALRDVMREEEEDGRVRVEVEGVKEAGKKEVRGREEEYQEGVEGLGVRVERELAKGGYESAASGLEEIRERVKKRERERELERKRGIEQEREVVREEERVLSKIQRTQGKALLLSATPLFGVLGVLSKKAAGDLAGSYGMKWLSRMDEEGNEVGGQYVLMSEEERVEWELRTGEVVNRLVRAGDVLKLGNMAAELVGKVGGTIEAAQRINRIAEGEKLEEAEGERMTMEEALGVLNRAAAVSEALSGRGREVSDRVGEVTMGGMPLSEGVEFGEDGVEVKSSKKARSARGKK